MVDSDRPAAAGADFDFVRSAAVWASLDSAVSFRYQAYFYEILLPYSFRSPLRFTI